MTDREDDFNRTGKDSEGRKVQQELERQLRELGDTMSDSFRTALRAGARRSATVCGMWAALR